VGGWAKNPKPRAVAQVLGGSVSGAPVEMDGRGNREGWGHVGHEVVRPVGVSD